MNINPMKIMQMKGQWEEFKGRHPKLPRFFQAALGSAFQEGTVMEITIRTPDGKEMASNIRLTGEDIALFREMQEMYQ